MVEIDGSQGGGQVLRTSVTLSMCSGETVTVTGIRGDRPEPGLKAQHLTAVETAADICDAAVEGATLGATEVTFDPGEPTGGTYEAAIGTAGSLTLLFDTVVPVATRIGDPLVLTASGGTDVKWSPPMAYYHGVKLPFVRRLGLAAAVEPRRTGFYPVGGGRATLRLWPSSLERPSPPPSPGDDGESDSFRATVYSTAAETLADADVADRQADAAVEALENRPAASLDVFPVETARRTVAYAETASPGSVVVVAIDGGGPGSSLPPVTAGFDAFGERGKPAEDVGRNVADGVGEFLDALERAGIGADGPASGTSGASAAGDVPSAEDLSADVVVDSHLADQVLVFLALGSGRVAFPRITDHVASNVDVCRAFGYDVSLDESGPLPVVEG